MKKQLLFALVLIAALLVATGSAAAKAKKTEFLYTLYDCSEEPPDEEWFTGKPPNHLVYHFRDQRSEGIFVSADPDFAWFNGSVNGVASGHVKLATNRGRAWGTFVKHFDNEFVTGTYEGNCFASIKDGAMTFRCIGYGTGDLEGTKYIPRSTPLDYIPLPDPCPGGSMAAHSVNAIYIDMR